MISGAPYRIATLVLLACALAGHPESLDASPNWQNGSLDTQAQPQKRSAKPPALPENPAQVAWDLLRNAMKSDKTSERASAIQVLGLVPGNRNAESMAREALSDNKPEIRTAAATALGEMKAVASIEKLKEVLSDTEPSVVLAAAHALVNMNDDSGYEIYYEILTGERKTNKGVIAEQTAAMKDPKKLAAMGFEEAIGFIPYAGIGWEAYRTLTKNKQSPVDAAAAKVLAKDPDPQTGKALAHAADHHKDWVVRSAALEALAKRGDPSLLQSVELAMSDDVPTVRYTAAAGTLHLLDVAAARKAKKKQHS
jgi:HEAT repeat protein